MRRYSLIGYGICGAILSVGGADLALPPAQAQTGALEEIVVTARRREERLQDVPMVVSAFSSDEIARRGIDTITDLAFEVPGLNFYSLSGGGLGSPVVRGLSKTNISGFENNVGVFFDNVFLDNNAILDVGFVDLERVEVAFGPQSALYGRNTFAGAISYVPKNPPAAFEGKARATVGTDERYDGYLSLGGPLVADRLSVLASYGYSEFDGTIDNLYGGEKLAGWDKREIFHGSFQVNPAEWLTLRGRYLRADNHVDHEAKYIIAGQRAFNVGGVANNCGPAAGPTNTLFRTYCGTIPGLDQAAANPIAKGVRTDMDLATGLVQADGEGAVASLQFGWVKTDAEGLTDGSVVFNRDAVVLPRSTASAGQEVGNRFTTPFVGPAEQRQWEFKLSSVDGGPWSSLGDVPVTWLLGGHLYNADRSLDIRFLDLRGANRTLQMFTRVQRNEQIDEWSGFGSLSATLAERVVLSFEGRYTDEEKCAFNVTDLSGLIPTLRPIVNNFGCTTFKTFTPRVTANYKAGDDALLYASWAKGTKTGGFNTQVFFVAGEDTFDDEVNETYEAGLKATWLGGRLTTNLAVYYIDWKDLQLTTSSSDPRNTNFIILNVGGAHNTGMEFSGTYAATDNLELGLGLSYGDPKFDDGTRDPSVATLGFGTDISGKSLPRQSRLQLTGNATYTVPDLAGDFDGFARLSLSHQSGQYADQANLAKTESVTLMNLALGLDGETYGIELWGKNLLNDTYAATALGNLTTAPETPLAGAFAPTRTIEVYLGNTRTLGVTVSAKF
jgi:iron complex outermembrane receptor protein